MEIIIKDGKKYQLVPVEESEDIFKAYEVVEEAERPAQPSIPVEIKKAVPVVSEYRERYKQRKIRIQDVTAPPKRYSRRKRMDNILDQFGGLIIGEGLEEDT